MDIEIWKDRAIAIGKLIWESLMGFFDDDATLLAAAISFYSAFSLAPLLVIGVAVASFALGEDAAQGLVVEQLRGLISEEAALFIQETLERSKIEGGGVTATVISLVTLFYGALKVVGAMQVALNRIWGVEEITVRQTVGGYVRGFFLILGLGPLILVSVIVSTLLTTFGGWIEEYLTIPQFVWEFANVSVFLFFLTAIFAAVFRTLPDVEIAWSDTWVGALVTAALFSVGKYLIGLYLSFSTPGSVFGAAGTLAVLLMWIFFSASIFFYGAEMTQAYAKRFGTYAIGASHGPAEEADEDSEELPRSAEKLPVEESEGDGSDEAWSPGRGAHIRGK
jgi:membrane protein